MVNSKAKERYFSQKTEDIVGTSADPRTHIYKLCDSRLMVREAEFDTKKGGDPIEITQISDLHFNYVNKRDFEEFRPCILSTLEGREWLAYGGSVPNALRALEFASHTDQTIITGDTLDFLSWGCIDLMHKIVWDNDPDAIITLGGHDLGRVCQGKIQDPEPLEERYKIVKSVWKHDIFYYSKTLGDKVIVVGLDNGWGRYTDYQIEKLKADIEKAHKENLILLIFQHEQLCTRRECDEYVEPLRINDGSGSRNFRDNFIGSPSYDEKTLELYSLITENADVIKGIFCGHWHSDYYTEIAASYIDSDGNKVETTIPQYVLTGNPFDDGHVLKITVR